MNVTITPPVGSASVQGDLWGVRARDYAEVQEPTFLPLYESAPFIEIARRRAPGGDFRVAEMESLPYDDGAFDAVTGFNAFQYAASPANALREARRVVKADGIIVIAVWGLPESCEGAGHLKALGSLMLLVHLCFRTKPSSRRWRVKTV